MIYTITAAGKTAANNATTGGPQINITAFKIGAGVAYTPSVSDTALHGAILYTGGPINYTVVSSDVVSYTLRMDETIGDFTFGEIGLYLADGTLFALSALSAGQQKIHSVGAVVGNVIQFIANLTLTNVSAVLTFPITQLTVGKILETSSVDLLQPPIVSNTNAYLVHSNDDGNNPILAFRAADFKWGFYTHQITRVSGTITAGPSTGLMTTSTDVGTLLNGAVVTGRYILEFLTGQLAGYCRHVSGASTNTLNWGTSTVAAPAVGDTFVIYQSNYSMLGTIREIVSVDQLITPAAAGYDSAVTSSLDDAGHGIFAVKASTSLWSFVTHQKITVQSGVVLSGATTTGITATQIASLLSTFATGKFIIQFTSGANLGMCRLVTSQSTNTVGWGTALTAATAGDTFDIYQSNSSSLASLDSIADDSFVYAILFGA